MRRPNDCQGCAYAGESMHGDEFVFCFRYHRHMPEDSRCDNGKPRKLTSQRFRKRSGRWQKK